MVTALERLIDEHTERVPLPSEFVVPGESRASALLDQARAVVRRAERRTVERDEAAIARWKYTEWPRIKKRRAPPRPPRLRR